MELKKTRIDLRREFDLNKKKELIASFCLPETTTIAQQINGIQNIKE